jgi:hypothetical protein
MTDFSKAIQLVSIWGIMLPLLIGLYRLRTAGPSFRLFIFFLIIGFVTDITMFLLQGTEYRELLPIIFNYYSLVEALTFLFLIYYHNTGKVIKRFALSLMALTAFLWVMVVYIRPPFIQAAASQIFDPFYEVIVAFLAGFTLLQLVEQQPDAIRSAIFWILLGVFFYCFCTFFIMGFLNTLLSQRIWAVNNIINILTYMVYAVGLWKLKPPASATFSS